jgi:AcrR family transcriptional regulator
MKRAHSVLKAAPYHHGNLREALIAAGVAIIDRDGLTALTFRACAREAGVSHGAPAHHLRDLQGLRTAIAAWSWLMLAQLLEHVQSQTSGTPAKRLLKICMVYVDFATNQPNRYLLMNRCDLIDRENEELNFARDRCSVALIACVAALGPRPPHPADLLLLRSVTHGYADLLIGGAVGLEGGGPGAAALPIQVYEQVIGAIVARQNEPEKRM